jgi:SAM-dependent methyltransferase
MFAYDEVPYDTEANPDAHPRSMATLARLFGRRAAAPSAARVLEIGCGDGEHMIAAASYLPRARFVGFDLAADAIARGAASARATGVANVELLHRDVRDVRDVRAAGLFGPEGAPFDYVVAHGVYSWVPEAVRGDVLAVMRSALGPNGIGFLSVNAAPGWELRRALRLLMREASAEIADPAEKVRAALGLVESLALSSERAGFAGVLAKAAEEYVAHVRQATPPDAPFSRYVFHDLLADCNDPFTVAELEARLRAAGLRILCETPLGPARAKDFPGLAAAMARSGAPFLQVLVHPVPTPTSTPTPTPTPTSALIDVVRSLYLWADLAPAAGGTLRTTTGAVLRAPPDSGLARAARSAPGFVAVSSLADDDETLAKLERDLFVASCEGVLSLASEPAAVGAPSDTPRVARYVRVRAREATERRAATAVLTSALHRSFRVPFAELLVVRELDGATALAAVRERVAEAVAAAPPERVPAPLARGSAAAIAEHVDTVLDRFGRYGFLLDGDEVAT